MKLNRRQFLIGATTASAVAACGSSEEPTTGSARSTDSAGSAGSTVDVDGTEVFFVERLPADRVAPGVLFLHGAAFDSGVWVRTGILDAAAEAGSRAVAVDLPGFGRTPSIDGDRGEFLGGLIDALFGEGDVVVVSPSMSGSFSLALIAAERAASITGFVAVAPVGISDFVATVGAPITDLPALLVWGSDDNVVPVNQADELQAALPTSTLVTIDDAGHAAYQDQPVAFTTALTTFIATL